MKRVGTTVLWSIQDGATTTAAVMSDLGFGDWTPRNNFATSLNKAIKSVKRDWDIRILGEHIPKQTKSAQHRRFLDTSEVARIAFTTPRIEGDKYYTDTALIIEIEKATGKITFEKEDVDQTSFETIKRMITEEYAVQREQINADEFRILVSRYVTATVGCCGIALRPSGGAYFVRSTFNEKLDKLKRLFAATGSHAKIVTIPIYDDAESSEALETATAETFEREIRGFIEGLHAEMKDGISLRAFENRIQSAEEIRARLTEFKDQLRTKAENFDRMAESLITVLDGQLGSAEEKVIRPFDLMAALDGLGL